MSEIIRPARPGDETELAAMIHELAEFERASADCTVTENQLREALFDDHPTVFGHIAEVDEKYFVLPAKLTDCGGQVIRHKREVALA